MQSQAIIKPLSPSEVFELTLKKVEDALGNRIVRRIECLVSEEFNKDVELFKLGCNVKNKNVLAVIFLRSDNIAEVVFYPGVDTESVLSGDIPLGSITNANVLDAYLNELNGFKIKKHFIISTYAKTFLNENHYVAITEINNQLAVVNPKGSVMALLSNPDINYIKNCIPEVSDEAIAAGIQDVFDVSSCGYLVAAIHAETVGGDVFNFEEKMQAIDAEKEFSAYVESKNTVENIDTKIFELSKLIIDHMSLLDKKIENEKNSLFPDASRIQMWTEKNELLSAVIYCLTWEPFWLDKQPENDGYSAYLTRTAKDLGQQKIKFPGYQWTNFFKETGKNFESDCVIVECESENDKDLEDFELIENRSLKQSL